MPVIAGLLIALFILGYIFRETETAAEMIQEQISQIESELGLLNLERQRITSLMETIRAERYTYGISVDAMLKTQRHALRSVDNAIRALLRDLDRKRGRLDELS